jgi:glycosyltransferase EpsD
MANILYIATSDIHLHTFHRPYIQWFVDRGDQIDLAYNPRGEYIFHGIRQDFHIDFPRSLQIKKLSMSYRKLKKLIDSKDYDLIHCHTPIPSFIARLAARKAMAKGCKVLYTAHGFHFYNSGPLMNWLIYYPMEYLASLFTDAIIVLNREDFGHASGKMLHKDSYLIPGIGVDSGRFQSKGDDEIQRIRASMGYTDKDVLLLYIAEFIPRKNHEFLLRCMPELIKLNPNIKLLLAGNGTLFVKMKKLAHKLEISDRVDFLGFRNDVNEYCAIADIGISVSKHEGLGLGVVEQMFCEVPVVATRDRGHLESVVDGVTGYIIDQQDSNRFIERVLKLSTNPQLRINMGKSAHDHSFSFRIEASLTAMVSIYKKYLP